MESYTLAKDSNFQDIEDAISIILNSESLRLRLPNSLQEKGVFGLEGLACQLLATWLRNSTGPKLLHTFSKNSEEDEFEDLSSSLYGICALRLADQVLTSDKSIVDSSIALAYAFQRVKNVISRDFKVAYKGMYVAIPSIKSIGVNREYNNPFYNNENLIGKEGFKTLVQETIRSVVPQPKKLELVDTIIEDISEIIRELFENTHKHGRKSSSGDILETNFRGVIFNSISVTTERLDKLSESGIPGMALFSGEWKTWMTTNSKNLPVLDITVVDAGPGYARRWTGKSKDSLSFEEEALSIYECFKKNNSTSPKLADGTGLTHVLRDLKNLRGWFRLRTGSISVSRSFFHSTGSTEITMDDIDKAGEFIEGTSFNFVIPLVDITKRES